MTELKRLLRKRLKPRNAPKLSDSDRIAMLNRYARGESARSLATEFGVTTATLYYHVKRAVTGCA